LTAPLGAMTGTAGLAATSAGLAAGASIEILAVSALTVLGGWGAEGVPGLARDGALGRPGAAGMETVGAFGRLGIAGFTEGAAAGTAKEGPADSALGALGS
jgi:hypothetical protein